MVDLYSDERAAHQSRENVRKVLIDATTKTFVVLITCATGFITDFYEKRQTASGSIDELTKYRINQGLMDASYQEARREPTIRTLLLIFRSIHKRLKTGPSTCGRISLRIRTRDARRGSSIQYRNASGNPLEVLLEVHLEVLLVVLPMVGLPHDVPHRGPYSK